MARENERVLKVEEFAVVQAGSPETRSENCACKMAILTCAQQGNSPDFTISYYFSGAFPSQPNFTVRYYDAGLGRFVGRDPLGTPLDPDYFEDGLNSGQYESSRSEILNKIESFINELMEFSDYRITRNKINQLRQIRQDLILKSSLSLAGTYYKDGMNLYGAYFVPHFLDPFGFDINNIRTDGKKKLPKETIDGISSYKAPDGSYTYTSHGTKSGDTVDESGEKKKYLTAEQVADQIMNDKDYKQQNVNLNVCHSDQTAKKLSEILSKNSGKEISVRGVDGLGAWTGKDGKFTYGAHGKDSEFKTYTNGK